MTILVDTSVAIPLLVATHAAHGRVRAWARGRQLALAGHALAETYSVLTRLPGDLRADPSQARALIHRRFESAFHPSRDTVENLVGILSEAGITGGAVYDALAALAARDNAIPLATLDARARGTYDAVGVQVLVVPS